MSIPKALTIAGSDSGGGAGIQADLKTFSAFRVFGMSVITAVTAQNSVGVQGVFNLPPEFVVAQIDSVLSDFGADAVKIGMLSTAPIIAVVAGRLRTHGQGQIVLDPVMIAKSGDPLLEPAARAALVKGGHLKEAATDVLWNGRELTRFTAPRLDSTSTHGTGCTFSAAIAAGLARRQPLGDAIREAKAYVTAAIREGFEPGRGVGALRHFVASW